MTTVTTTRTFMDNQNHLNVEWWIGNFVGDLKDNKQYYSHVFPADSTQTQFRLKLCVSGYNSYLIQLSFCVWNVDIICESTQAPSVITIEAPVSHSGSSTLTFGNMCLELLPKTEEANTTFANITINEWNRLSQYLLHCPSTSEVKSLNVKLTISYPDVERGNENLLQVLSLCDFKSLLDDETYADVTVAAAGGVERRVHKTVLVARSKVFHAMFRHDMSEGVNSKLQLDDVSGELLDVLLSYLYLGYVPHSETRDYKALLVLADKYELSALKLIAQEHLYRRLSVENAAETLALALLHGAVPLKEYTLIFIAENGARKIMETKGWQNIKNVSEISSVVLDFQNKD